MFGDIVLKDVMPKREIKHQLSMSTAGPKGHRELHQVVCKEFGAWRCKYTVRHDKSRPKVREFYRLDDAVDCYNEGR